MTYPFRDAFLAAIDEELYPIAYLDWLVQQPHVGLWHSDSAAIIAELKQYPSGALVVHGVVAAGDLEEIRKLIPLAEEWGRRNGCIRAQIDSRAGWQRVLKQDGYLPYQAVIYKDLR